MGVVIGVMTLVLIVLAIAWASGAFEGRRSSASISSSAGAIVCRHVPEDWQPDLAMKTSSLAEEFR
jgi:hypothetical protein